MIAALLWVLTFIVAGAIYWQRSWPSLEEQRRKLEPRNSRRMPKPKGRHSSLDAFGVKDQPNVRKRIRTEAQAHPIPTGSVINEEGLR